MSGNDAGIYAITRIENNPKVMTEFIPETKYWLDEPETNERLMVQMTVLRKFLNNPILKKKLQDIEGLKYLSILNRFQGSNFPVKDTEWKLISNLF